MLKKLRKMESILIWKTVLWTSPIVGVVLGGILSVYANFKIHNIETLQRISEKAETVEYRAESLQNIQTVSHTADSIYEQTKGISVKVQDNKDLIVELNSKDRSLQEKLSQPELNIIQDLVLVKGSNNHYSITVKNFGKSTATNVRMIIKYIIPQSLEFIIRVKELPSGEKIAFNVPMVPDNMIIPINPNWPNERDSFIEKFNNKSTQIMFQIKLEYNWDRKVLKSREYTFIHEQPMTVTIW